MARYYGKITKEELLNKVEEMFFGEDKNISKVIYKDLEKVEFEWENDGKVDDFGEDGYVEVEPGFHIQLLFAGGDCEMPIHFAVYWDGEKLRAYIPKDGNPWDKKNKIAWEYEEWKENEEEDPMDYNKMIEDIKGRIKFNEAKK